MIAKGDLLVTSQIDKAIREYQGTGGPTGRPRGEQGRPDQLVRRGLGRSGSQSTVRVERDR
jgi:hypothetical protein